MTNRIENMALTVLENIVEAQYTRNKRPILLRCNLQLEKIRVLLRLCHTFHYLPNRQYEFSMRELQTIGSMLGGWIRSRDK